MATPKHLQRSPAQYDDYTLDDGTAPAAAAALAPANNRPAKAPPAERVLIDPRVIENSLPIAKAVAAGLGWFNSVVTTMFTAADLQIFITSRPPTWVAWAGGFLFAAALTFGQIYSSGRNRTVYAIFLFPDALMTALQWGKWLFLPLFLKLIPTWWIGVALASIIGGIIGIVSARTPERLTFGKRA